MYVEPPLCLAFGIQKQMGPRFHAQGIPSLEVEEDKQARNVQGVRNAAVVMCSGQRGNRREQEFKETRDGEGDIWAVIWAV